MNNAPGEPPDLPHMPPMHWLDRAELFLEAGGRMKVRAFRRVDEGHPFVRRGYLERAALIELMAQAAAAGSIMKARRDSRTLVRGYLAAVREMKFCGSVPVGATVELICAEEKTFGPLTQGYLEARLSDPGVDEGQRAVVATARMTFHLEFE